MTRTLLAPIVAVCCTFALPQLSSAAPTFAGQPALSGTATKVAWRRHWHRHYGWYGRYPTAHSFYRHGRCVEDLGYGRVELCD